MLKVVGVTSSGNDGNIEGNVLDGNLATRWSCLGSSSWIQLDVGSTMSIGEVDIAWYKGDTGRISQFQITVSKDNLSFQPVFTGASSGTTASLEKYNIGDQVARYVRITVNGNNQNQWASITEVELQGPTSPPPPPPTGTRTQTRTTTTTGDPVPDANWTITSDTGPLPSVISPMVVQNEVFTTQENTAVNMVLSVTNNQSSVTWTESTPSNGKLSPTSPAPPVAANMIALTYTPNQDFTGQDLFTYSASDDKGNTSNVATVTISVTATAPPPPPAASTDKFGYDKIYGDASPPVNNWVFNGTTSDSRYMEQRIQSAGNGWFEPVNPTEFRLEIKSDPNVTDKVIPTFKFQDIIKKGYMYKPVNSPDGLGDWGAIEQTWRVKVVKPGTGTTNGECHTELVPGGYAQNSSLTLVGNPAVPIACEAWSYHFNMYCLTGRVKNEKDSMHTPGYTVNSSDPQITNATSKWDSGQEIIQKAILYPIAGTTVPTGGPQMKLELWVDMTGTGHSFKKVLEKIDDGKWGPTQGGNGACCGNDSSYQYVVCNAARCAIGFRCDNMVTFWFKDMSIRSIDPTKRLQAKEEHEKVIKLDKPELEDKTKALEDKGAVKEVELEEKSDEEKEADAIAEAKRHAEEIAQKAKSPAIREQAKEVASKAEEILSNETVIANKKKKS